ncbi:MAG: Gfo/Idh/MocA family oxidoreductase [Burkholderiaceae bacterium]
MVGLGKMGLSHHAIVNAHPGVKVVAACDQSAYLTSVLSKYTGLKCYDDYERLLANESLDAVVIATPSKLHAAMVESALQRGLHVFCEKPFVLNVADGERLVAMAEAKGLVNQVGYHFRFVGAFQEAARIANSGALGQIHHVRAEAFGPVVLRPKGGTWRSSKGEGGGALYDYACHALDLVTYVAGAPSSVSGVALNSIFSRDVEDEVYCTLNYASGTTGQLSVNWSDESYRKMSTKISVWGTNGRITADRQECQIYLRAPHPAAPDLAAGWTVRYTTDLTREVWYYLRGEEYSAQIDHFVRAVEEGRKDNVNSFRSALQADRLVSMILAEVGGAKKATSIAAAQPKGVWSRLFG